jgi:staphyloferrin B biosynthesis citrate synthase
MSRSLRDELRAGRRQIGTTLCLPGATTAELLAEPFDLVWIDLEHAAFSPLDAQEAIIGAQAAGAYALARLPADAHSLMTTMLDAGADGVVLANVTDAASAETALSWTRHAPVGARGFGPRRAALRGRSSNAEPATPSVWLQIESALERHELTGISALPGVDALVVGTVDLSFSVGTPLETGSAQVKAAVREVFDAAGAAGVPFGVAGALDDATAELAKHAAIVVLGTDARLCAAAADSAAQRMREIVNVDSGESQKP